ncbi:MAG: hypothetical protein QOE23_3280 [Pseudonocardiales bacterium]|nr:hypothetical protein [Pseudonocardiales bacterium]
MARSEEEIAKAIAENDAWLDAVDPARLSADAVNDRKDLRQVGVAMLAIEAAERSLIAAVSQAKANGRSWTDIANVLGVSRQAARQRFDARLHTVSHPPLPIFVDTSTWHTSTVDNSSGQDWNELVASQRRLLERLRDSGGWVVLPCCGADAVDHTEAPSRSDTPSRSG